MKKTIPILLSSLVISSLYISVFAENKVQPNISNITTNSATISWNTLSQYKSYVIEYGTKTKTENNNKYDYTSDIVYDTQTGTLLKNLKANTKYFLSIYGYDKDANDIVLSDETSFQTKVDPNMNTTQMQSAGENNNTNITNTTDSSMSNDSITQAPQISQSDESGNIATATNLDPNQVKSLPKTGPSNYLYMIIFSILLGAFIHMSIGKKKIY